MAPTFVVTIGKERTTMGREVGNKMNEATGFKPRYEGNSKAFSIWWHNRLPWDSASISPSGRAVFELSLGRLNISRETVCSQFACRLVESWPILLRNTWRKHTRLSLTRRLPQDFSSGGGNICGYLH